MRMLTALLLCLLSLPAQAEFDHQVDAKATLIKDGDTPYIEIRMYGIDTPEKTQLCERPDGTCYECGSEATAALTDLIKGKDAIFKFTGDSTYGRPVAMIFIEGQDMNLEMVRLGWAVVYERYLVGAMKEQYLAIQQDAKDDGRGIWQGPFIQPHKWRNVGDRLACEAG